jgi:hypothetical protein
MGVRGESPYAGHLLYTSCLTSLQSSKIYRTSLPRGVQVISLQYLHATENLYLKLRGIIVLSPQVFEAPIHPFGSLSQAAINITQILTKIWQYLSGILMQSLFITYEGGYR